MDLLANRTDTLHVNVMKKMYVTDDEIFQRALDTNKKNKVLRITIKKGNYFLNEILYIKRENTILEFEKDAIVYFVNNKSGIIIQNNYCTISNASFIGNEQNAETFYSGFGIMIYAVKNAIIKNCTFKKISGNAIYLTFLEKAGCSNCKITNNKILENIKNADGIDKFGILLGYSGRGYNHNDNIITGNYIDGTDNLKIGIGIIGHGHRNTITNNTVKNCLSYGILSYESQDEENALTNTTISNNTIENIGETGGNTTVMGMGIYLMSSHYSIVSGNKVYNTLRNSNKTETLPAGAIAINGATNVIVENNEINGSYMYGFVNAYGFNSIFRNNTVTNVEKSGVYLINVNDVNISGNVFRIIKEVALKGYFGSTKNKEYSANVSLTKYKNISTGEKIYVEGNTFYYPNDVLFFSGKESKGETYLGNKITYNRFESNKIYQKDNNKKVEEMVFFREEVKNTNKIKNNIILK